MSKRGGGLDLVLAGGADEVADHRHVGIEHLRTRGGAAVDRQRALRPAGTRGAGRHVDTALAAAGGGACGRDRGRRRREPATGGGTAAGARQLGQRARRRRGVRPAPPSFASSAASRAPYESRIASNSWRSRSSSWRICCGSACCAAAGAGATPVPASAASAAAPIQNGRRTVAHAVARLIAGDTWRSQYTSSPTGVNGQWTDPLEGNAPQMKLLGNGSRQTSEGGARPEAGRRSRRAARLRPDRTRRRRRRAARTAQAPPDRRPLQLMTRRCTWCSGWST